MEYRKEVDGLRALAVLPVIFCHAGFQAVSGGYVGVDIFFVISGFLITRIVLDDLAAGTFTLAGFYERRVRRIFPALGLVLMVSIVFAWLLLPRADLSVFSSSLVAVSLFASNLFFAHDGAYFETAAELKPLLHTWSLAVEEQYYVFFPLFLMAAWKWRTGVIATLLLALAAASLALAQWTAYHGTAAAFFLLYTRAWELAVGALIGLWAQRGHTMVLAPAWREAWAAAALAAILFAILAFDKHTPFPGLYTLVPVLGAAGIILFATPATLVGKALGAPPMVAVGLISYSAYLWHQPLFAFARRWAGEPGPLPMLALAGGALVLAAFSWRFVERPFRSRARITRRTVFWSAFCFSALAVVFGLSTAPLFDDLSGTGPEAQIAKVLRRSAAVYIPNVNERKLVKYRIQYEDLDPGTIVIGSSRAMQIGDDDWAGGVLNLAVSGATVEDDVAIASMATRKFRPATLVIGADPWLFNAASGPLRWRAFAPEYRTALTADDPVPAVLAADAPQEPGPLARAANALYENVNRVRIAAGDDAPAPTDKLRRDGTRVYNTEYAHKSQRDMEREFGKWLAYEMSPYVFSAARKAQFERLLQRYGKQYRIVLVLAPYHPKLYRRMQQEHAIHLDLEPQFRDLARRYGLDIAGSYDPAVSACGEAEFYDAIHPNGTCMARLMRSVDASR